ncbi:MAG: Sua5/YciO/YrdC/YwlC family protein [Endozoicomonas sp. (ex Botrylloides leachii)]|nr:Sua5/YciO/YrdC/YwlC family protein [Endozoicomonas sp. (ex Botrylloides leachii)]
MILDIDMLNHAAKTLTEGGVIAYPTEAVWGLGCCPWRREAVQRILNIKSRPQEKGIILVGVSEEQFEPLLAPLGSEQRQRVTDTWPGPYTWIVPDPDNWAPDWVRGQFDSVAIRVSNHPVVRYLCASKGTPIVSTSANKTGEPPLLTQKDVEDQLANSVDFIAPGDTGAQKRPSEIRDLITGEVVREG